MEIKSKAFVLKTTPFSESDLIVTFLTQEDGVIQSFVRGAKNSKKRFGGGVLQPPHLIEIEASPPKRPESSDLYSIKEAKLIRDFSELKCSYLSLTLLASMIKLLLKSEAINKEHFNLLGHGLTELHKAKSHRRFFSHFVTRYLNLEGAMPDEPVLYDLGMTPINKHSLLSETSIDQINREAAIASHYLQSYTGAKSEFKWPK
jgi:DNA repair protein RecO (recombination protein O)